MAANKQVLANRRHFNFLKFIGLISIDLHLIVLLKYNGFPSNRRKKIYRDSIEHAFKLSWLGI